MENLVQSVKDAVRAAYAVSHECTISDATLSVVVKDAKDTAGERFGASVIVVTPTFVSQRGKFWGAFYPELARELGARGLFADLINGEVIGVWPVEPRPE